MRATKKIDQLAQKLIEVSKVDGIVDESNLWQGVQAVKESNSNYWIPLLKTLKKKLSRILTWQTAEVTSNGARCEYFERTERTFFTTLS